MSTVEHQTSSRAIYVHSRIRAGGDLVMSAKLEGQTSRDLVNTVDGIFSLVKYFACKIFP